MASNLMGRSIRVVAVCTNIHLEISSLQRVKFILKEIVMKYSCLIKCASIAKKPYVLVIFQGVVQTPCPPLVLPMIYKGTSAAEF